ncbi:hypothetical protein ACFSCW_16655 [Sphingomonas tabacisoli]|uniref:DUF4403 family protein n=1 Tax=Sphingomonas tabacisoli TaxID=2249466 RepID=A0ABW4I639_9SPHN
MKHGKPQRICAAAIALSLLPSCSTEIRLLELQRSQLRTVDLASHQISVSASQQIFDPSKYDLFLFLNGVIFDQILAPFDGFQVTLDHGRPIQITLASVRLAFRAGSPLLSIDASAKDIKTGLRARVRMDARFMIEGDAKRPDTLQLRLVATRFVPELKFGPLDFEKWIFLRELTELKATEMTAKLPPVPIPLKNDFGIGGKAGSQTISFPTGNGSSVTGTLTYPDTYVSGAVRVQHVLFLKNGIHVYANVEGL